MARYKPRSDTNPTPGGTGFLRCPDKIQLCMAASHFIRGDAAQLVLRHYSSDGKYVTVASGKGDPAKDIMVDVFKDCPVESA